MLFLHEEFSKQVAFPRKALETEFSYYGNKLSPDVYGTEVHGTDVMHKLAWLEVRSLPLGWFIIQSAFF